MSNPVLDIVSAEGNTSRVQLEPTPVGSGGDASIYRLVNHPNLAAKIYHEPGKDPTRPDKIRAMLAAPPDLPHITENNTTYVQMAWPEAILEKNKKFVGYAMPFVDLNRSTVLENLLSKKNRQISGLPDFYGFRIATAANRAALTDALHKCGHHIIDLKPVNLNVYLDTFYTALLDCDGLSILGEGGKRFAAHQYTDGYIAPEALQQNLRPQDLEEYQDRFALAVIIFQLLNRGIHPYQGVPLKSANLPPTNSGRISQHLYAYGKKGNHLIKPSPWTIHTYLEDDTRYLFDSAFGSRPEQRPSASQWKTHLRLLADPETGKFKKCAKDPNHGKFSKGCGFCALDKIESSHETIKAVRTQRRRVALPTPRRPAIKISFWKQVVPICLIVLIITGIFIYHKATNIHAVINNNDHEEFYNRVRENDINWNNVTIEDALKALDHDNDLIFCEIIKNISRRGMYTDFNVFSAIIKKNNSNAALCYIQNAEELGADADRIKLVITHGSKDIQDIYVKELKKRDAGMSYRGFEKIFLSEKIKLIREVLKWGVNPNYTIKANWQLHAPVLKVLHKPKASIFNSHKISKEPGSPLLKKTLSRFGDYLKIPGNSIYFYISTIVSHAKLRSRGNWGSRMGAYRGNIKPLTYKINPVIIAAYLENIEYVRLLIEFGANPSWRNYYGHTAYSATDNHLIHTELRKGEKSFKRNDPDRFLKENPIAELKEYKATKQKLIKEAISQGNLHIVDLLFNKYQYDFSAVSPELLSELLVEAYKSGNPMLLAYLLKKRAKTKALITLQDFGKYISNSNAGYLFSMAKSYKTGNLKAYVRKLKTRYKASKLLHRHAVTNGKWGMAMVIDDHISKWNQLHIAVVNQQTHKIRSLLKTQPGLINVPGACGRSPIALAVYYNCPESFALLMKYQPNLDAEDKDKKTPLMHAISHGNHAMIKDLIVQGASLTNKEHPECAFALDMRLRNLSIGTNRYYMLECRMYKMMDQLKSKTEGISKSDDFLKEIMISKKLKICP